MALSHVYLIPTHPPSSSPCSLCRNLSKGDQIHHLILGFARGTILSPRIGISDSFSRVLRKRGFSVGRWEMNAIDTRIAGNGPTRSTITSTTTTVEIPVTCYQLIGVTDRAEKDEIVKAVMQLKSVEVEEGYTMDAVVARQNLLMDVRDKLLFEPEYAGNVKEKIMPKSSLRIPWSWLPGALCLLQEVGEEKTVLDIGRAALQHPDSRPYIHDLLLSMALVECTIAKIGFEKNKVSHGFEALARAQCLLRSKISLGKMPLLSQIEESLEELAPACTLELVGMPHLPENTERRRGAISALCELLRQGLDVETSCRVQDWPCFLSQALNRLMATEIVELLPWDDLALARKNKKSIESQNQRVVVDFSCFYVVLIAHIALGFSSKQLELINKAKIICECLMASEGVDLKFEETFCLFLLGRSNESQVVEKLHQLELSSNHAARCSVPGKEIKDVSGVKPSLETWLKDAVLAVFSDTRDCSPSLVKFFVGEKRAHGIKKSKVTPQINPTIPHRPVSDISIKCMDSGEPIPHTSSSRHLGSAVKQLAPADLQSSLILGKSSSGDNANEPSVELKRNLGANHGRPWESMLSQKDVVGNATFVAVVGCIVFSTFKLGMNLGRMRIATKLVSNKPTMNSNSLVWTKDSHLDYNVGQPHVMGSGIAGRMKKLLNLVKTQFVNWSEPKKLQSSGLAASVSSSITAVSRKKMPVEEAEELVKQWQAVKAEALGPSHQVHSLPEILDESMLSQWEALADAAKARSCYWRFVLLQLSVLQADIWSDGFGVETAEIEALLEEAAELVDESLHKNPSYYSTYRIRYVLKRQDGREWRFCEGDIHTPSPS